MHPLEKELRHASNPLRAKASIRFFKTGPGQYAEDDVFLGVTVPDVRRIINKYQSLPLTSVEELLRSTFHECRLAALLLLVEKYKHANAQQRMRIVELYLRNIEHVNNWDLVDSSAHKIIGPYCDEIGDMSIIEKLSTSGHLWPERIAVIATLYFIVQGKFDLTLAMAERFLDHPHDLIHKAVGWMLREVGKKDERVLTDFLKYHAALMPRTMFRYAIERLSNEKKKHFMQKA